MATNILMPALSPTMTEGTLSRWLKKEGENVRAGDVIAEIETDKATMEVEAVDEGVLGKILVADGTEGVKVNEPIAILVDQGEAVPASAPAAKLRSPRPLRHPNPAPEPVAKAEPPARPRRPQSGNGHDAGGERVFASPLARRMAKQAGHRSGGAEGQRAERPHRQGGHRGGTAEGRASCSAACCRTCRGAGCATVRADHRAAQLVPHSSIRKVIARRLTEAKSTIPHFYVSMDVEIDAMIKLMDDLNAKSPKEGPERVSDHDQRPGDQGVGRDIASGADGECRVDRRWNGAVRRCRHQHCRGDPGRPDYADRAQGGPEGAGDNQPRDEGPGGACARWEAEAGGIPGRRVLDLQHGHVRGDRVCRDHQSAAGGDPGGGGGAEAAGGEE